MAKLQKDLLDDLHYKDARNVLAFHTSPDSHPDTFNLDKESFNNIENLNDCHRSIDLSETLKVAINSRI